MAEMWIFAIKQKNMWQVLRFSNDKGIKGRLGSMKKSGKTLQIKMFGKFSMSNENYSFPQEKKKSKQAQSTNKCFQKIHILLFK